MSKSKTQKGKFGQERLSEWMGKTVKDISGYGIDTVQPYIEQMIRLETLFIAGGTNLTAGIYQNKSEEECIDIFNNAAKRFATHLIHYPKVKEFLGTEINQLVSQCSDTEKLKNLFDNYFRGELDG
jgi:hypothetical protein